MTPRYIEESTKYSCSAQRSMKVYAPETYLQEFGLEWSTIQTYKDDDEYNVEMDIDTVLSFDDGDENMEDESVSVEE